MIIYNIYKYFPRYFSDYQLFIFYLLTIYDLVYQKNIINIYNNF
jgi:hypothetical protein